MKNKLIWIILGTLILLTTIFYFGSKVYFHHEAERVSFLNQNNFKSFVPDHAIRKGSALAKVIVVEFFDPECESCREFNPYIHQLMNDYENKIQLVLRYAPFHGNSIFAIKILEAARMQEKYWETLELLYLHQPEWGNHHNPRPELVWTFLPSLGLDIEKLKKDMESPTIQNIIKQDQIDAQLLNVRGTPTFFVNGKELDQFGPDYLKLLIDENLKEF
jgi:protein-disulfide isomerase